MSAHIKDIARQLAKRAEEKAAHKPAPAPITYATLDLPEELEGAEGALRALARNVVAQDNLGVVGSPVRVVEYSGQLKQNCVFIKQAYVFLGLLECPGDVRDIILWFAGYSEGNFKDLLTITQEQMAKSMGLSIDTVQRKLKALETWEQKFNRTVIEIRKQPYDYKAQKYQPTQYRVLVGHYIEEYAKRVKGLNFTERESPELLTAAIESGHKRMAEEIADEMPMAPIAPRKQKDVTPPGDKFDRLNRTHERLIKTFEEWCELSHQMGFELSENLPKLQDELRSIVERFWTAYEKHQKAQ